MKHGMHDLERMRTQYLPLQPNTDISTSKHQGYWKEKEVKRELTCQYKEKIGYLCRQKNKITIL